MILEGVGDNGDKVCDWGGCRRAWVSEVTEAVEGYVVYGVIVLFDDEPEIMDVLLLYKAGSSWYDDVGEKKGREEQDREICEGFVSECGED